VTRTDPSGEFERAAAAFRTVVEAAAEAEPGPWYARRLRNAVARVYLAAALAGSDGELPQTGAARSSELETAVRDRLGSADLAREVMEIYDGLGASGAERWGGHAVDVLRPLHALARAGLRAPG
jgi:hypothetical protein